MNRYETVEVVRKTLQKFQDGYECRDLEQLDEFMQLFVPDDSLEIIGTNASSLCREEWCLGPAMARSLVESDWRYWGDVRIDMNLANIHAYGDVAWLSAPGTVSQHVDTEKQYGNYLEFIQSVISQESTSEEKVLRIQLGCASTIYEMRRGEDFVWPFRFTAVLVQREQRWLFQQVQFSFPTTRFPDERIIIQE